MAHYSVNRQKFFGAGSQQDRNDLHEVMMIADRYGNIINPAGQGGSATAGAFGELITSELSPFFQLDGLYGIGNAFRQNQSGSGSSYVDSNGMMTVSSGTTTGSFATLRSNRSVRYRPGQGSVARFTAMWPDGQTNGYQQVAGYINQNNVLGVGYNVNNSKFAVLRRYNSNAHVAKFVVTAAATGNETVTFTLNDVVVPIPVTSGTINFNTAEIGNFPVPGWIVDYCADTITMLYNGPPGELSGTFSVSSSGTFAATYSALQTGVAPNDTWIYQDNFNIDSLDGKGPSGMLLDTTKLNVFQVDFRWLGAGRIRFMVEDGNTGQMFPFHEIRYANSNTVPHLSNPSLRIGYAVVNAAPGLGTGSDIRVKGASMMGGVEGKIIRNNTANSVAGSSAASKSAGSDHHVLTIKNNRINEKGKPSVVNQREIIIQTISAAVVGTGTSSDPVQLFLYLNADTAADLQYTPIGDGSTDKSETVTTITSGQTEKLIGSYSFSPGSDVTLDVSNLRIILTPLDRLSLAIRSTGTLNEHAVNINFEIE